MEREGGGVGIAPTAPTDCRVPNLGHQGWLITHNDFPLDSLVEILLGCFFLRCIR